VEDEHLVIQTLEATLDEAGFTVRSTGSGEQAITMLDDMHAELCAVLTDINLSGKKQGWDVARHARELNPECRSST
jgi:CheY-like chemotaxis protein